MEIIIKNITKKYKPHNIIFDDINIIFNSGKIVSIVAPNGSGKTTLLNMILKITGTNKGELTYSKDLDENDVSIVYGGDKGLYLKNTVSENIKFFALLKGLKNIELKERLDKYGNILIDYEKLKDITCERLSHGQKRLIQIFISIVLDSKIIILDELTEGLDFGHIDKIKTAIEMIKKDKIIIICSHDYEFIENISDRVYFIINKKLVEIEKKEIKKKYLETYERNLLL